MEGRSAHGCNGKVARMKNYHVTAAATFAVLGLTFSMVPAFATPISGIDAPLAGSDAQVGYGTKTTTNFGKKKKGPKTTAPLIEKKVADVDRINALGATQGARKQLPSQCRVILRGASGDRSAYGANCLSQNFSDIEALPASCAQNVRTGGSTQSFFVAQCLSSEGWNLR